MVLGEDVRLRGVFALLGVFLASNPASPPPQKQVHPYQDGAAFDMPEKGVPKADVVSRTHGQPGQSHARTGTCPRENGWGKEESQFCQISSYWIFVGFPRGREGTAEERKDPKTR